MLTFIAMACISKLLFLHLRRKLYRSNSRNSNWVDVVVSSVEDMGPTAVKVAQTLSSRDDLIGERLAKGLERLQSNGRPVQWSSVERLVSESLERPCHEIFRSISPQPVATGSIAQVYSGQLVTGEFVCIKVKRPEIDDMLRSDLSVLFCMGKIVSWIPGMRRLSIDVSVSEVRETLLRQLDLSTEARNSEVVRLWLEKTRLCARVPKIYMDFCSPNVITMEQIDGLIKIKQLRHHLSRQAIAMSALEIFFSMLFDLGIVHADLHPGNILVDRDGNLVLLDFGLVSIPKSESQESFRRLFLSMALGNGSAMADVIISEAATVPSHSQAEAFRGAIRLMMMDTFGSLASEFDFSRLVSRIFVLMRRHGIQPTNTYSSTLLAVGTFQGTLRRLAPDADFQAVAASQLLAHRNATMSSDERKDIFSKLAAEVELNSKAFALGDGIKKNQGRTLPRMSYPGASHRSSMSRFIHFPRSS